MNILVVAHYQGVVTPTAIYVHDQMKAYIEAGNRVRVIVPTPVGKMGYGDKRFDSEVRYEVIDGIEHFFLRHLSFSNYGERKLNAMCALGALKRHWKKIRKDFDPDVIHAHTLGTNSELGAWIKLKTGKPFVITTHGSDTFVPFQKCLQSDIKRRADKGDVVVAVSTLLQQKMMECNVATKTAVILNGFNLHNAGAYDKKAECSLIQVSSLIGRKKVDVTIRAFSKLKEQNPDATLTIIGEGVDQPKLEALCSELHIEDAVRFLGKRSNEYVLNEMAKSSFFVMPSVREGFGIVYLEAMANGCVTIGTKGEGIQDLIVHGENGFLVSADDPDAIAGIIFECLADPARTDAIARKGEKAARELTWQNNAQKYIALFEELLLC